MSRPTRPCASGHAGSCIRAARGRLDAAALAAPARALSGEAHRAARALGARRAASHALCPSEKTTWRTLSYLQALEKPSRSVGEALAREGTGAPNARSSSSRATTSSTRCCISARCTPAFPTRRSRRPTRCSPPISPSCGRSSELLTPGLVFVSQRAPYQRAIDALGRRSHRFGARARSHREDRGSSSAGSGRTRSSSSSSLRGRPARRRR